MSDNVVSQRELDLQQIRQVDFQVQIPLTELDMDGDQVMLHMDT